ncbi:MAG: hypothetical protein ACREX8_11535, partial [Gammaproteobacteria bacterium]
MPWQERSTMSQRQAFVTFVQQEGANLADLCRCDGRQPQAIGLHVQWGVTTGSLQHLLGVSASATVIVQRDGSLLK